MPTESAAGGRSLPRPPQLEPDRTAFLAALKRVAGLRGPTDPIGALLLDPRSLASWDRFASRVFEQSARHSLVAAGDRLKIYTRHILDSLNPLEVLDPVPRSMLDIGSGAGFPGIPLAIAWPASTVTLLESRQKKVGFLERVIREIPLPNVRTVPARLEEFGQGWCSEPFDTVAVRAVGGLASILRHAARAVLPGARWVYFLGSDERAVAVLETLDPAALRPRVQTGLFSGTLLTGSFHSTG